MINTLLFDFSWVLAFPYSANIGSSKAYQKSKAENQPWQNYLVINQELIDFIKQNQSKYKNYIFSASSQDLLNEIKQNLIPPFLDVFSSKELNFYKHRPEGYKQISSMIKTKPNQILFVDDNEANIQAANQAGLKTIHFLNTADFIKKFNKLTDDNSRI